MTYSDFTLADVDKMFGVQVQPADLFLALTLGGPALGIDRGRFYIDNVGLILAALLAVLDHLQPGRA